MQYRERQTRSQQARFEAKAQVRSQGNRRHAPARAECFNALSRHVDWPLVALRRRGMSRDVARDTDELTQTARQYEQVPDTMSVPDALVVDEEVDADTVDDSAGHEPCG